MLKWNFSDTYQYLEPFQLIDLCWIELFGIELFDHLNLYLQNVFTNYIFDICVKPGFGIK